MKTLLPVCVALILTGAPAAAQDRGRVGIAMGYPNTVSVIWHATDRIAIQPRISFARNSGESVIESQLTFNGVVVSTTSLTTSSEGWSVGPGIDLRVSVARWDNVSAYVTPGFTYFHGSSTTVSTSENAFTGNQTETREISSDGHEIRGAFGVQYTPHRRFAVYGEFGVRYTETRTTSLSSGKNTTIGNTSGVGAIFYF